MSVVWWIYFGSAALGIKPAMWKVQSLLLCKLVGYVKMAAVVLARVSRENKVNR